MGTPAFVELTTLETQYKSGVGQDTWRKIKDDFTNLNRRTLQLESDSFRISDHFNWSEPSGSVSLPDNWDVIGIGGIADASYPSFSVVRVTKSTPIGLQSRRVVQFDLVQLPLEFKGRFKRPADRDFRYGLRGIVSPIINDVAGIWMERVDASNWRFVSYDGTRNNGSSFGNVGTGNWFEVDIVFTDDPSNRALCYLDGVLKDTLTLNLPISAILHATAQNHGTTAGDYFECDRIDFTAQGGSDAS